jgi:hypothetical protein
LPELAAITLAELVGDHIGRAVTASVSSAPLDVQAWWGATQAA